MRDIGRRAAAASIFGCLAAWGHARAGVPVFAPGGNPGIADGALQAWSDISLEDADGNRRTLFPSPAPLVLVHLWANWCVGCISEMDGLGRAAAAAGQDLVEVVLVSHPANWRRDKEFAARSRLPFTPCVPRPGTPGSVLAEAFSAKPSGSYAVPQSLGITRDYRLAFSAVGPADWDGGAAGALRAAAGKAQA